MTMVRRCWLRLALLVVACLVVPGWVNVVVASDPTTAEASRPNILYIYVDDMGWGSIGPNGQADRRAKGLPSVRTPNIDRLARQGVNFTRGYGCTVCSPARSSQQSGFHQGHTFADRNDPDNAKKAMRADDVLIGDALSRAGYVTGYWGKWGYGGSKDQVDPVIQNVQTLPTSHGYQHVLTELHHVRAHTFFQPTLWRAPVGGSAVAAGDAVGGLELVANSLGRFDNPAGYPISPANQNSPNYPATAYCDDSYAFAALDFLRTQGKNYNDSGQPFLALLAVQVPHGPFDEVATFPEWDKAYVGDKHFSGLSKQSQQWAAMVTRIDTHLGNLLAALDDPDGDGDQRDSIAENTLVVFQSDNGGPSGKNNVELDANGGLRGVKGSIYEGGLRVPLVMRWPGHIFASTHLKAGSQTEMMVDVSDLCPTFCELAGAEIPLGVDGVSIAPTLLSQGHQRKREFLIHEAGTRQSIIRDNYKLVRGKRSELALYDLSVDRSETNDLAESKPAMVKELETLLLGERVDEPRGFANTYHEWTGVNEADVSKADNWSDYRYENAGITYMEDSGAPHVAWVAHMANSDGSNKVAVATSDVDFLALQIGGASAIAGRQTLRLADGVHLNGRNEIRLREGGTLECQGATIDSLRWVDIGSGGILQGTGVVNATVFNAGTVVLTSDGAAAKAPARQKANRVLETPAAMTIHQDYHQQATGTLELSGDADSIAMLRVDGGVILAGELKVTMTDGFQAQPGRSYPVLAAKQVEGTFANEDGIVTASNGMQFSIQYLGNSVVLTAQ